MVHRKNVLFVCIGNVCRSPMAEALARTYGPDVIMPKSAGLYPGNANSPLTRAVLKEKNIELGNHQPCNFRDVDLTGMDLIINMSGYKLPAQFGIPVEDWTIRDPIGQSSEIYREVCADIEMLVMRLILRMRTGKFDSKAMNS
ncbi:MAG: low molecular weight phosphatase family protein [Bryobacteraceae bacterium]